MVESIYALNAIYYNYNPHRSMFLWSLNIPEMHILNVITYICVA